MCKEGWHTAGVWRNRWLPVLPSFNPVPTPRPFHSGHKQSLFPSTRNPLRGHTAPSCACPVTSPPHPGLREASCSLSAIRPSDGPSFKAKDGLSPQQPRTITSASQAPLAGPPLPAPSGAPTPIRRLTEMRHSAGPLFLITPSRTLETGRPLPGLPVGRWLSSSQACSGLPWPT